MKTTYLNAADTSELLGRLIKSEEEFYWSVAWATNMELFRYLLKYKKKIRKLVVGTDFSQTHPDVLEALLSVREAKIAGGKLGATFHPKVYGFVTGDNVKLIIGSANFTAGGTGRNEEACVLLEGVRSDRVMRDALSAISVWWKTAIAIDPDYVRSYRLKWASNQTQRAIIEKPVRVFPSPKDKSVPDVAFMTWADFYRRVKDDPWHSVDGRVAVLEKSRMLFNQNEEFSDFADLERSGIAGFIGKKQQIGTEMEGINWGWFGSMSGAGVFKSVINANSRHISDALSCIPLQGEVAERDYFSFVVHFKRAFAGEVRKGGVATASRLLAMKRPDIFVCLDKQNKEALSASFGFRPSSVNLDNYWELIVEPIMVSAWWNSERPRGRAGRVWDGRAAFLDALFYEAK